jgi:hypothetical protein
MPEETTNKEIAERHARNICDQLNMGANEVWIALEIRDAIVDALELWEKNRKEAFKV